MVSQQRSHASFLAIGSKGHGNVIFAFTLKIKVLSPSTFLEGAGELAPHCPISLVPPKHEF